MFTRQNAVRCCDNNTFPDTLTIFFLRVEYDSYDKQLMNRYDLPSLEASEIISIYRTIIIARDNSLGCSVI